MKECKVCVYSERKDDVLVCRRYPPTPLVLEGKVVAAISSVDEDGWCGEFERTRLTLVKRK